MSLSHRSALQSIRAHAAEASAHAFVPYSQRAEAAVLLLSDGSWVPGVRVESASFSLVIPAVINAFSTAVAAGRRDVVAAALNRPATPAEAALLHDLPGGPFEPVDEVLFVRQDVTPLPEAGGRLSPFLDDPAPATAAAGIALARAVAERAYVPESQFPVGCVLITRAGSLIPGVNVEHPDWARILCAERNALGTAVTWGLTGFDALYLTCLKDPSGTPCGACRQVLVELAPEATLWMDRSDTPPESTSAAQLLPGAFSGAALSGPGTAAL